MAATASSSRRSSSTEQSTPTAATTRTTRSSTSTTRSASSASKVTSSPRITRTLVSPTTTAISSSSQSVPSTSIQSSPKPRSSPFGALSVGGFVGIMIGVVIVIGLIVMVLTSLRHRHRKASRRPRGFVSSSNILGGPHETSETQNLTMPLAPVGAGGGIPNSGGHYAAVPSMSKTGSLVHLNPGQVGYAHGWQGLPEPYNSGMVDYRDSWRSASVPPAAMEYTNQFSSSGMQQTTSQPFNESWGALPSPHDSPYLGPLHLPQNSGSALRGVPDQHGFLPRTSGTGQTYRVLQE